MTRVTQSMLSTNMLRNLNTSYSKMSKLQDQINTGRKFTRASDDPVAAVKGMDYRVQLDKIGQFTRNTNEMTAWLDTTDSTLSEVTNSLTRVQELITQAANDTNTEDERKKIAVEIDQIQRQIRDLANTQVGGKYIFSGTHTHSPLFEEDAITLPTDKTGLNESIEFEVGDGIYMRANTPGYELFKGIDEMLTKVLDPAGGLQDATITGDAIGSFLTDIQNSVSNVLDVQSTIGANQSRLETVQNRLSILEINVTKQMSENEDVDYSKAITEMTTQESIHQAALSVGAKIIQQTLVDFIR
ncbi:MAG: flagellar hook-associated protein FlgL [Lysinibacillus sp.]